MTNTALEATKAIARKIIRKGHAAGYQFSLADEEGELLVGRGKGEQELIASIGATGMEYLRVWLITQLPNGHKANRMGSFLLIAENGEDNPSDYSWRTGDELEALRKATMDELAKAAEGRLQTATAETPC